MSIFHGEFVEGEAASEYDELREDFIKRMEAEGNRIVLPQSNELQVDIDSDEQYAVFQKSLACLKRNETESDDIKVEEHPSRSGLPRRHITITMPFDLEPWERIAFQAALGSDPIRELVSIYRLMRNDRHPTLFVEAPITS
jgi:hypothetical protein